jgi:hypothetical protein
VFDDSSSVGYVDAHANLYLGHGHYGRSKTPFSLTVNPADITSFGYPEDNYPIVSSNSIVTNPGTIGLSTGTMVEGEGRQNSKRKPRDFTTLSDLTPAPEVANKSEQNDGDPLTIAIPEKNLAGGQKYQRGAIGYSLTWEDLTPENSDRGRKNGKSPGVDELFLEGIPEVPSAIKIVKVGVTKSPGATLAEPLPSPSPPLPEKDKGKDNPPPPPAEARMIIRTGELEFEVASFAAAVKEINALLKNAMNPNLPPPTTRSEKLANGKMRGSVIVRVPPAFFDQFVNDLSRIGDLKKQSIGSADVTKQYTDNESELRSLRITEKRCEEILKNGGKGDVKDLIAAEMAMGTVRSQIEKIEGENQYTRSQVALCTLTITLTEKQIENPAVLTISEKVTLGIAVPDVKKALSLAQAAALELQGRVVQVNESKESKTKGYFAGLLEVEVPHENAGKLRSRLEGLGELITQQQSFEQTDGGSIQGTNPRKQFGDVRYSVRLLDQASLRPRETLNRKIAVRDVLGAMTRLREKVANLQGQVSADPVDQARMNASFEFDLASDRRADIEKLLPELGDVLEKGPPTIVPPAELASRARIGYKLTLVNFVSQPVRESADLIIEVKDVDASLTLLRAMFKESNGTITVDKGPFDEKGELQALINSAVPVTARNELVQRIMAMGRVKHQELARNVESPESSLPLAVFRIRLTGTPGIVPNDEGLWPQIRTSLYYAFRLLTVSLMFIVVGVCVLLPWAVVIMVSVKLVRRWRGRTA